MPKIEICSCKKTPNYCALEAVGRFMLDNYAARRAEGYKAEREIKVSSGRTVRVTEVPIDENSGVCDCSFRVDLV